MNPVPEFSGGCQCGAVRFHVRGALPDCSICHCRMCQKAFGAYYAPLVSVRGADFQWTRGEPRRFQSSNHFRRGFCADCGTPLTYEGEDGMAVSAGAFDQPERLPPTVQYGTESKLPFVDELGALEVILQEDDPDAERLRTLVSRQHPDHDTPRWPR